MPLYRAFAHSNRVIQDFATQWLAEHSLNGEADALRGADFSTLEAAHEQVRKRDREAKRSIEYERDISRDRDDGSACGGEVFCLEHAGGMVGLAVMTIQNHA